MRIDPSIFCSFILGAAVIFTGCGEAADRAIPAPEPADVEPVSDVEATTELSRDPSLPIPQADYECPVGA